MANVRGVELNGVALMKERDAASKRLGQTMAGRPPMDMAEVNSQFATARARLADWRRRTRPECPNL